MLRSTVLWQITRGLCELMHFVVFLDFPKNEFNTRERSKVTWDGSVPYRECQPRARCREAVSPVTRPWDLAGSGTGSAGSPGVPGPGGKKGLRAPVQLRCQRLSPRERCTRTARGESGRKRRLAFFSRRNAACGSGVRCRAGGEALRPRLAPNRGGAPSPGSFSRPLLASSPASERSGRGQQNPPPGQTRLGSVGPGPGSTWPSLGRRRPSPAGARAGAGTAPPRPASQWGRGGSASRSAAANGGGRAAPVHLRLQEPPERARKADKTRRCGGLRAALRSPRLALPTSRASSAARCLRQT